MTTLQFRVVDSANEQASYAEADELRAATCLRRLELARELDLPDAVRSALHRSLSEPGPHDSYIWEAAACWTMPPAVQSSDFAAPYLAIFGYEAESGEQWRTVPSGQRLEVCLDTCGESAAHEEYIGHTWYMIRCSLCGVPARSLHTDASSDGGRISWVAPRRLAQLRESLHDPVKATLGDSYAEHFADTPFAKHGGPVGTTARLGAWLGKLVELINGGSATPNLVALTLFFLRGPPQDTRTPLESIEAATASLSASGAGPPLDAGPAPPCPEVAQEAADGA